MLPVLDALSRARDRRPSLAELAELVERSPSYFQRAFSRVVGESPKRFTKRLQLEYAAVLLWTTEDSILDVALTVGFASHEGFTRAFSASYGRAPKDFRRHGAATGLSQRLRHAHLLTHVGPCLRLFRAPLVGPVSGSRRQGLFPTRETTTMHYDITTQSIDETTLLYKSARCEHRDVAETLAELLPAVFQHMMAKGVPMEGPPTVLYMQWGPATLTLRAGIPVAKGTEASGDVEVAVLPAGPAAVTIHRGSYDGLGDAHAALERFLHERGAEPRGPLREVYLTDPGEVPNPDDWRTQLIWPVRA
jgi:AraC family transcriptional regulator